MGSPCFVWYPDPDGTREVITWPEAYVSDIQERPIREVDDAYDGARGMHRIVHAGGYLVRIIHERFTDRDFERELSSMSAHLERGGAVAFCTDSTKIFGAFRKSTQTWKRGDSNCGHGGNAFTAWSSSGAVVAGDEVVIESANPEMFREYTTCGIGPTSTKTPLTDTLKYSYSNELAGFIRYRDFYPVLRLPKSELGKPIVTHDHRIAWTLDVTLEYDFSGIAAMLASGDYEAGALALGTDTAAAGGASTRQSLDKLLAQAKSRTFGALPRTTTFTGKA